MLTTNQPAPDFNLADQKGKMHQLADHKGKWLVIYFYPKDDTPGCTIEACQFRDNFPKFKKLGITILGVSIDKVTSHDKFVKKFNLPFTLLADPDKKMVADYQVWGLKEFMGREYMGTIRTSYLINPEGKIAKVYDRVRPKHHVDDVLRDLEKLKAKQLFSK